MAWFKVDDGLHSSKKFLSIPKRTRFAAIGLWTIAGSWCADQLTDGHVPDYMIREWGPPPSAAEALVDAGFWERETGGYAFRNWLEYQPSRADVDADRDASRERMRRLRAAKRSRISGESPANPGDSSREQSANPEDSREIRAGFEGQKPQDSGGKLEVFGRTLPNRSESVRDPDPTRPDPTNKSLVALGTGVSPAREQRNAALRVVHGWTEAQQQRPPSKLVNDVAAEVQKLVNEGIPESQISAGVAKWWEGDSYSAKNIPNHVARAGQAKLATGTTRAKDTLELVKQLEMEESGEPF